ncbi:sensor histidine kinase [Dictyobacter kobayashii]|uniref:histidine kinase n=1 Tax=Dictyobacter kobayashii TaxID=2014872 RepID=A0A402AZH5_9CHLR|nr:ATP-binding protein [Dictyobacter kobayashii]GCE24506.1 hypothetical protein KDK_83060 [Dictyobacter kobayashii]
MREQWNQQENPELTTLFQAVFEPMTVGVFLYNRAGYVVHINTASQKMLELQPEEIIGRYYSEWPERFGARTEQGQLPVDSSLQHTPYYHVQQQDAWMHLSSGRELLVNVTSSPLFDQHNRLIGYASLMRDITHEWEKEHHTLNAFTSLLKLVEEFATIPDQKHFFGQDETGEVAPIMAAGQLLAEVVSQVISCSYIDIFMLEAPDERQHIIGISGLSAREQQQLRKEVEGTPLRDYIDATAIADLHANHVVPLDLQQKPYVTTHTHFGARYRLIAPMVLHGQLIGILVIAKTDATYAHVTMAYPQEEIALIVGTAKLIALVIERVHLLQNWAEVRASEMALKESNRRYDLFVNLASHELRTPLTTFKGNVDLALRRLHKMRQQHADKSAVLEKLACIQEPLEHAVVGANMQARMISDLLDTSRIQRNTFTLQMAPCNLQDIVRTAIEGAQMSMPERKVVLHPPEEKATLLIADADRLTQVVANYLSNALKYSPVNTSVEVNIMSTNTDVRVSVHDKGPGLTAENQQKIWDRFYQLPDIIVPGNFAMNGLGLGLYLNRMIIALHQGHTGVISTPGHGSTFWFQIPRVPEPDPPPTHEMSTLV